MAAKATQPFSNLMKQKSFFTTTILCVSLTIAAVGCRQKSASAPASGELEKAEKALATAVATPAPESTPNPGAAPEPLPAQQMKQAVEAYKGGKLEDAVTRLQKLRATPTMTAQQRMALNDAMAAVMADIYAQAAKGDARALAAVKQ